MSSAQQTVRLQYAVAHFDSETHRLATMTNHQSSLAEYLQQLGIDPNNVVAVDIDSHDDRQNPLVAVFYHH